MSPQAQRVAIAEACPDIFERHSTWDYVTNTYPIFLTYRGAGIEGAQIDPLADLNACHEMEKVLTDSHQKHKYASLLGRHDYWALIHATPEKRAWAFLRTLNLWDDTK